MELLLTLYKARHFPNVFMLMVLDNCGPHKTPDVETTFKKAGWLLEFLPPNMTDELQPMDLVVNAVGKQELRRVRIEKVVDYFVLFKTRALFSRCFEGGAAEVQPSCSCCCRRCGSNVALIRHNLQRSKV